MTEPTLLTIMELSRLFGVSSRTVRVWLEGLTADSRVVGRGNGNLYSMPRVCAHRFGQRGEDGEMLDLNAERARLAKEQADKIGRENSNADGNTFSWPAFEPLLSRALSQVRTKMLAAPRKLAPQVIGIGRVADVEAIIDDGIREALEGASLDSIGGAAGP